MKNGSSLGKYPWLPYLAVIAVFLLISMAYFAPQFRGEVLDMHDVTQYVASSGDIEEHYEKYGEDPQWTGNSFGGMPSYMINFKVHSLLIRKISKWPVKILGEPAVLIFTAMLFFWLMMLLIGINPWIGLIPSLAYGFSTYTILIIGAGHINKVWAMAYIPLLVGAIWHTYRAKDRKGLFFGGALAALAASLEISANHPQITWYFLLVIVALVINEFIRACRKKGLAMFGKATAVLAVATVLAVASNTGTLYYTAQHTGDTTRGGSELTGTQLSKAEQRGLDLEYATAWSYGRTESFNMFIPDLMGGSSSGGFPENGKVAEELKPYNNTLRQYYGPNVRIDASSLPGYWGDQPMTAGPTYIGAVMFFLAVLALFLLEGRKKWWLFAVSILALFLSWGNNMMWFTEMCFRILPGYNKFRAVATALVIVQWSIPVLAALILAQIWKSGLSKERLIRGVKWAAGITGGVALFFALFGGTLFSFRGPGDEGTLGYLAYMYGFSDSMAGRFVADVGDAMAADRLSMLRADAWRSLAFVALGAGVILLFVYGRIKRGIMAASMAVLVCADLIPVDARYLSWDDFVPKRRTEITARPVDQQIMTDGETGFRVADLSVSTFSDAHASYFHRSVGGYHGAKLQRYQDLIDRYLSKRDPDVYNMLNVKYFIVPDGQGNLRVQENADANGTAWFVGKVVFADTPDQEIDALATIDNKTEAVVGSGFADSVGGTEFGEPEGASIELTDYKVNHLTYRYTSPVEAVAVFSEIYYDKGWTAYIDGVQAPYFRADYVLRGMKLPAGDHTVEFTFRAPNFGAVSAVTLVFSLLIILAFCGAVAWIILDRKKNKNAHDLEI